MILNRSGLKTPMRIHPGRTGSLVPRIFNKASEIKIFSLRYFPRLRVRMDEFHLTAEDSGGAALIRSLRSGVHESFASLIAGGAGSFFSVLLPAFFALRMLNLLRFRPKEFSDICRQTSGQPLA